MSVVHTNNPGMVIRVSRPGFQFFTFSRASAKKDGDQPTATQQSADAFIELAWEGREAMRVLSRSLGSVYFSVRIQGKHIVPSVDDRRLWRSLSDYR